MKRSTHAALFLGFSVFLMAGAALATDPVDPKIAHIRNTLAVYLPGMAIDHIAPAPVDGLYEVVSDSRLLYVSEDGRFILQGAIFDLEGQRDITKPRISALRAEAVDALGEDNMLIYEPAKTDYQVTVFTDIDCPYCRKMHGEMDEYLKRGIRIRYLFYPRAGKNTPSYDKAVSVWCADDRKAAMDAITSGGNLAKATCPNPVDAHMALADKLPIRGTPALVLTSGEVIPGYLPPDRLLQALKGKDKNQ